MANKILNYFPEQEARIALQNDNWNFLFPLMVKIANGIITRRKWFFVPEDVIQLSLINTWLACQTFDFNKGKKLYSFLTKTIQNQISWMALRFQDQSQKHYGDSLEEYLATLEQEEIEE